MSRFFLFSIFVFLSAEAKIPFAQFCKIFGGIHVCPPNCKVSYEDVGMTERVPGIICSWSGAKEPQFDINWTTPDLNNALHVLVFRRHNCYPCEGIVPISQIKNLIKNGIDINAQNRSKKTALTYAAEKGDLPVIKLLLDNKAKLSLSDSEPREQILSVAPCEMPLFELWKSQGLNFSDRNHGGYAAQKCIGKDNFAGLGFLFDNGYKLTWKDFRSWVAFSKNGKLKSYLKTRKNYIDVEFQSAALNQELDRILKILPDFCSKSQSHPALQRRCTQTKNEFCEFSLGMISAGAEVSVADRKSFERLCK